MLKEEITVKMIEDMKHCIGFKENKVKNIEFKTQLKALVDFGILELLEILKANVDEKNYQKELQKVKLLIQPTQLAERFKCLSVRK